MNSVHRQVKYSGKAAIALTMLAAVILLAGIAITAQAQTESVLPPPSSGKAIVCLYRTYRFTGSSSHDELYVNGTHLAKLLNSEYAFLEVLPGTVVISGIAQGVLRNRHHVRRGGCQSSPAERKRARPL